MQLRNIINWDSSELPRNKIEHQIDNEGCKCHLCQKIVINEMKVIKTCHISDNQSEFTKGKKQEFFSHFIMEFNFIDKMTRKVKIIFPEICVFEKGVPTCLASKKRETLPIKTIKNKEKLNGFEINNFFIDGFIFHNNYKESVHKVKTKSSKENDKSNVVKYKKEHFNYDEALKNECIAIAKFINGTCQMITPIQLTNLFKSKQRAIRNELLYISTLVCSANYE